MIIKTQLGTEESARRIRFEATGTIVATDVQEAIEEVASEDIVVRDTLADLTAATLPVGVSVVETLGYAAAGDGGGARWKRVGSAPSHPGKTTSNGGTVHWEMFGAAFNQLQFGADPTGVSASDTAFENLSLISHATDADVEWVDGDYKFTAPHDVLEPWRDGLDNEIRPSFRSGGRVDFTFANTVSGQGLVFDAGSLNGESLHVYAPGLVVGGNANLTDAVYAHKTHRSYIRIGNTKNCTTGCRINFVVEGYIHVPCSGNISTFTRIPVNGCIMENLTSYTTYTGPVEGVSGDSTTVTDNSHWNTIRGGHEINGGSIVIDTGIQNTTIDHVYCEQNGAADIINRGIDTEIVNFFTVDSSIETTADTRNMRIVGGFCRHVVIHADSLGTVLDRTSYTDGLTVGIQGTGPFRRYGCFKIGSGGSTYTNEPDILDDVTADTLNGVGVASSSGITLSLSKLGYDNQLAVFTVGHTITGGTSGATARIVENINAGASGTFILADVVGVFQNNEAVTDTSGGDALVDGTLSTTSLALAVGKTLTASNSLTLSGTDGKSLALNNSGTINGGDGWILAIAASKSLTVSNSGTVQGADGWVLSINGKTVTHNATTTFDGTDGKTLTVNNSGTIGGGDGWALNIAASKTLAVSNSLTFAGIESASLTFQNSGTVVNQDSTDILTNKTYDTAGAGNVFKINGTQISDKTGTGKAVLDNTPTLITPVIGAATGTSLSVSGQLTSTVATGTAPLVVSSTTNVANLNASLLNGVTWSAPGTIGGVTPGDGHFAVLTAASGATISNGNIVASTVENGLNLSSGGRIYDQTSTQRTIVQANGDRLDIFNEAGSVLQVTHQSAGSGIAGTLALGSTTIPTATRLSIPASTTSLSQINLATGAAPTSPVDGDVWREDNTNTGLKVRINGVTKTITVA